MPHHDWNKLQSLMPAVRDLQALASSHGIDDVFQDNGGKILQMLLALNLQGIPGREGNDAVDAQGREYELKSVNVWLTASFSTNHHINPGIIDKYRQVEWVFAIYEGIEMRRAYQMPALKLEPYFTKWTDDWDSRNRDRRPDQALRDINNPKIPLNFVIEHGDLVYSDGAILDLKAANRIRSDRNKKAANRKAAKRAAQADLVASLEDEEES